MPCLIPTCCRSTSAFSLNEESLPVYKSVRAALKKADFKSAARVVIVKNARDQTDMKTGMRCCKKWYRTRTAEKRWNSLSAYITKNNNKSQENPFICPLDKNDFPLLRAMQQKGRLNEGFEMSETEVQEKQNPTSFPQLEPASTQTLPSSPDINEIFNFLDQEVPTELETIDLAKKKLENLIKEKNAESDPTKKTQLKEKIILLRQKIVVLSKEQTAEMNKKKHGASGDQSADPFLGSLCTIGSDPARIPLPVFASTPPSASPSALRSGSAPTPKPRQDEGARPKVSSEADKKPEIKFSARKKRATVDESSGHKGVITDPSGARSQRRGDHPASHKSHRRQKSQTPTPTPTPTREQIGCEIRKKKDQIKESEFMNSRDKRGRKVLEKAIVVLKRERYKLEGKE